MTHHSSLRYGGGRAFCDNGSCARSGPVRVSYFDPATGGPAREAPRQAALVRAGQRAAVRRGGDRGRHGLRIDSRGGEARARQPAHAQDGPEDGLDAHRQALRELRIALRRYEMPLQGPNQSRAGNLWGRSTTRP